MFLLINSLFTVFEPSLVMVKQEYIHNNNGLYVAFQRMREGPHYFSVGYRGSSRCIRTVKQMKQLLGSAKFLQSSKDLYEWMENILTRVQPKENLDMQRMEKEGFGPEAHGEEPNDNTKMVT